MHFMSRLSLMALPVNRGKASVHPSLVLAPVTWWGEKDRRRRKHPAVGNTAKRERGRSEEERAPVSEAMIC